MMIRQAITTLVRNPSSRTAAAANHHKLMITATSTTTSRRTLVSKSPGADPLELLRKECVNRNLCDVSGYRLPGVHWVFSVAISPPPDDIMQELSAPNLRTVGIQRVSPGGIDFVMKRGSKTADSLAMAAPLAVLYSTGKYVPGQSAEQWRGEGHCETINLMEILHCLPHYTLTGMLVSRRIEKESLENNTDDLRDNVSGDRLALLNKSHVTEINQKTRLELENDQVTNEELEETIKAFRFSPDRLERMHGGPDSIMWDRWEWLRSPSSGDCPEGSIPWNEPKNLLPH